MDNGNIGNRKREAMKIDAMPTPRREDLEFPGSIDGYTILKPLKPYKNTHFLVKICRTPGNP